MCLLKHSPGQNSQINAFVAGMHDTKKMATLHFVYGKPLADHAYATLIEPGNRYRGFGISICCNSICEDYTFLISLFHDAWSWSNSLFLAHWSLQVSSSEWSVQNMTAVCYCCWYETPSSSEVLIWCGLPPHPANLKRQNEFRQIWSLKVVHLLSVFVLAYCGLEVTIGSAFMKCWIDRMRPYGFRLSGWSVTYLIHRTGGGSSSGYVSSGFFGGMCATSTSCKQDYRLIEF